MSKHWVVFSAALVALSGCQRSAELMVRAVTTRGDGEIGGLAKLQVRLVPYNRDSIFDELVQRAGRPEPQVPADLLELRDSVSAAQARWRDTEATWNEARSELEALSQRMQGMNRASSEYHAAFRRFGELEDQERRATREKDVYFEQFTELQTSYNAQAESLNAVIGAWENEAFEDYGEIVDSLLTALGRAELWDTTDANGWALFRVPAGRWWVHTRFALPYEELYWNIPLQLGGGAKDTLVLDATNAELRHLF